MIPTFPVFKKLELSDKSDIESVTSSFPPYSDFNFVSMWSYDTNDSVEISVLQGNLVLKFQDYISLQPFFTFIGTASLWDTVRTLLEYAQKIDITQQLKLIPEIAVSHLPQGHRFHVTEDRDNFDYVIRTEDLIALAGTKYLSKRNHVNTFTRLFGDKTVIKPISVADTHDQHSIMSVFGRWEKSRRRTREQTQNEMKAIQKLFLSGTRLNLHAFGLIIDGDFAAFSIDEKTFDGHGLMHFEKADTMYTGIFEFLKRQAAIRLREMGCDFINMEQDLGLAGLRDAKMSYRPDHFLKKYLIGR
jgi:uncharacterized protein